jgi:hypothetical protein
MSFGQPLAEAFPFVSVGSTQSYNAVQMGPTVTTDNDLAPWPVVQFGPTVTTDDILAPWPIIYFNNCVMQEGA